MHNAQAKTSRSRLLCLQGVCILAVMAGAMGDLAAQNAAPTPPYKVEAWVATLPGGEYSVGVAFISAVSIHEYTVDNSARVAEVNISTPGSTQARFYFIEPNVPKAPSGIGQSTLNFAQEKAEEALNRAELDDVWKKVSKNYPTTTHAHTVEFRIPTREDLDKLYDSAKHAWLYQRPGTFKLRP